MLHFIRDKLFGTDSLGIHFYCHGVARDLRQLEKSLERLEGFTSSAKFHHYDRQNIVEIFSRHSKRIEQFLKKCEV